MPLKCKDPRDKLFGICSLFPADLKSRIRIDYSASVSDIYASATRTMIETYGSAHIITWKPLVYPDPTENHCNDLPSWSMNWGSYSLRVPFSEFPVFNASGNLSPSFRFLGNTLQIPGFQVGVIEHVQANEWGYEPDEHFLRFTSFLKHSRNILDKIQQFWSVDEETYVLTCLGGSLEDAFEDDMKTRWVPLLRKELFDQKSEKVHDDDMVLGRTLRDLRFRVIFVFRTAASAHHICMSGKETFKKIGLGNEGIEPGDIISILFGFKAPVLLRPVGEHYRVLCDAYIRDYMQGEVIESLKGEKDATQNFSLI
jgi:hypothetical protein